MTQDKLKKIMPSSPQPGRWGWIRQKYQFFEFSRFQKLSAKNSKISHIDKFKNSLEIVLHIALSSATNRISSDRMFFIFCKSSCVYKNNWHDVKKDIFHISIYSETRVKLSSFRSFGRKMVQNFTFFRRRYAKHIIKNIMKNLK